jgi:hypothetical protein
VRVILFALTLAAGLAAIAIALLMPAHLRATDPHVIRQLGAESRSLVQFAAETATHNPPVAKILLATAESLQLPGTDQVVDELRNTGIDRTRARTELEQLEAQEAGRIQVGETPILVALRKAANRERLLTSIKGIESRQILRNRALTNLVIFGPVKTAAGLPLDVAILTTAFLLEHRAFPSNQALHDQVLRLASQADPPLEEFYLSIFALAKRFSSEQLIALMAHVPNVNALHSITRFIQEHPNAANVIYSAILISKNGGAVATFIDQYPDAVEQDLRFGLSAGVGGLERVLKDQQPVYRCSAYDAVSGSSAANTILRPLIVVGGNVPTLAILLKFVLLASGGFLVATAARLWRNATVDQSYVFFPKLSLVRRVAFAAVFLILAIVIGEPYLAQGEQKTPPRRVSFPLLGAASPNASTQISQVTPMIDQHTILAIVTFLVLQAAIYAVCLVKLAEIKKQPVPNVTKLKLLDNEDNLFDGGLYCGLFGTAASLIMLTLGIIKPSLVSAYSSTLFGILFVALLKIGHVRPLKRRLLLDTALEPVVAEVKPGAAASPTATATVPPARNPFA